MSILPQNVYTTILLFWLLTTCISCPPNCSCHLDEKTRKKISCLHVDITVKQLTTNADKTIQILEIKDQIDNPAWISISAMFQTFINLEELHIVQANVREITKHAFWGLKSLSILNLMKNNISQIQEHNFKGLANLKELYLDYNNIKKLLTGTFKYLTDLKVLSLAENKLQELEARVFERLGKLQELNLSGNMLKEIYPEVFMDIQELRVLKCRRCGLRNMNAQIYHLLLHLTTLDLGDNNFFYLTNEEFYDLRNLEILWLDGNYLSVILEKTFIMQRYLQKVSLARNRLAKVTNTAFYNVTTLKELNLSYNNLIRIEPVVFFSPSESLEHLDISGNKLLLSELKYSLQGLRNLQYLGLADLNLTDIPLELFERQTNLRCLNLSGNFLNTIPTKCLKKLSSLTHLDLSRNKFQGINETTMEILEKIHIFNLQDNPFICDLCNIYSLVKRNNDSNIRTLTCEAPKHLRSRQLETLKKSELISCEQLNKYKLSDINYFARILMQYKHVLLIIVTTFSVLVILFGSIAFVRLCCFSRTVPYDYTEKHNMSEQQIT